MQSSMRQTGIRVALLISFFVLCIPGATHAATAVDTHQILPPTGQACPVLGATDVTPHVYDGALHSFDISITDPSYVAITAQVGDTPVSFEYMTRWFDQQSGMRIHVDLTPRRLYADTPVTITLIAAHAGGTPITCVAVLSTIIPKTQSAPVSRPTHPISGTSGATQYPWSDITVTHPTEQGTSTATTAPVLITATHSLGGTCGTANGPVRLWVVLLVLYAIFVWILCSQKEESWLEGRDWSVGLTVAGFIALLFFWYISAACRTGSWAPIIATLIACAGLIALTGSGTAGGTVLLLKDGKR